jgi:hypothetical protein
VKIIGIMAFLFIGAMLGNQFLTLLTLPEVQAAAEASVPFLAGHMTTFTLVAGAVFAVTVVAIPPVVLSRERDRSETISSFEKIGVAVAIMAGITSIGYLVGVGWIAATALL